MLDFLSEANWWCLLLLLLLAFLLGLFLARRTLKKQYITDLEECERKNSLLSLNNSGEKANSTFVKPKLNFDSFGKAEASQKDDLKKISGVGPFIEEKLNSIGIYTFDQISKFTLEDINTVTELIEFFPGRIERDGWTKQAKDLKNK